MGLHSNGNIDYLLKHSKPNGKSLRDWERDCDRVAKKEITLLDLAVLWRILDSNGKPSITEASRCYNKLGLKRYRLNDVTESECLRVGKTINDPIGIQDPRKARIHVLHNDYGFNSR